MLNNYCNPRDVSGSLAVKKCFCILSSNISAQDEPFSDCSQSYDMKIANICISMLSTVKYIYSSFFFLFCTRNLLIGGKLIGGAKRRTTIHYRALSISIFTLINENFIFQNAAALKSPKQKLFSLFLMFILTHCLLDYGDFTIPNIIACFIMCLFKFTFNSEIYCILIFSFF